MVVFTTNGAPSSRLSKCNHVLLYDDCVALTDKLTEIHVRFQNAISMDPYVANIMGPMQFLLYCRYCKCMYIRFSYMYCAIAFENMSDHITTLNLYVMFPFLKGSSWLSSWRMMKRNLVTNYSWKNAVCRCGRQGGAWHQLKSNTCRHNMQTSRLAKNLKVFLFLFFSFLK